MSASLAMQELMSDPSGHFAPKPPPGRSKINRKRPQTAPGRQITTASKAPKLWRSSTYNEPNLKRRKFIVTLNHKKDISSISRNAPYANRAYTTAMATAARTYSNALNKGQQKEIIPIYNPLCDPHLNDYYARKFGLLNSRDESRKNRKQAGVAYQFGVKTGDKKGSDTDAKVYIQVIGTKDKIPKKRLFKKQESEKTERGNLFKFDKGTVEKFAVQHRDIGDPVKLIVEHDGNEKRHGWFLEEITLTNIQSKKSWLFPCHKWLSKYEGDRKLCYELKPLAKAGKAVYEVSVLTGDKRGAGTDANVSVTLFGKHTSSPKIQLLKSSKHKNPFERNNTDEFKIRTRDVGKLSKIRIEHDNAGFGPGWFLDKVIICNLEKPNVKYYCPCNQWLAKDVGDKSISRDLTAYTDPNAAPSAYVYIVHTFTGNKRGAGTDANVYAVIFGDSGDTGEKRLDNSKNNFEKSRKDTFKLSCSCVGKLERLRIRHDNTGLFAGWYLDKVVVEDPQEQQSYTFYCRRWLSKTEDDGEICRDLIVSASGDDGDDSVAPKGYPYHIHVTTSDVKNAGTDAEVYVVMHGEGKKSKELNSGKLVLANSEKKKNTFERAMTDIFHMECAEMLSPLTKLTVGHDNKGLAAGWHLDRIVIDCPTTGIEQTFLCQQWLDRKAGDGLTERELVEAFDMRKTRRPKQLWFAWIWTSDIRGAGTDANVSMQIYGDKGKSQEIKLGNNTDNFEQATLDKFKLEIDQVGVPYKLRIGHDNSNAFPGWHLDKVKLENMNDKEQYLFNCNRWLSRSEEDNEIIRELPASGPNCPNYPIVIYEVSVHTGNKMGGGTDANVFIKIYGELGDSGYRPLKSSKSHNNKFERNQVDVFHIEAVTLKALKKIKIGHDGNNPGAGWFLDKVVIKELNGEVSNEFPCNRWLSKSEDDGQIVRELFLKSDTPLLKTTSYHISVKTGDVRNAGTDANVFIQIFGAKDDTGRVRLKQSLNTSNKFERNRIDKFIIEAAQIGKIEKIIIGHDGKGLGSGWFLDYIELDVPSVGRLYRFSCHQWFDSTEGDRKVERELYPSECIKSAAKIPYQISVHTGDIRHAGTDSNVFAVIYGENGKTEELKLRNKSDNFERGQVDVFKVECEDVGKLRKLRIGHDSAGMGSAWFLDKVYVRRLPPKSGKKSKETDEREEETAKKDADEPEKLDENNYLFVANRWLSKEEGDRQTVIEISPVGVDGALAEMTYTIRVITGNKFGCGTNANVFINMYGEEGDSGERQLKKSETHTDKFERNQEDVFKISCLSLGELKKIKIRHDNSGFRPAWFLDKVIIEVGESKYQFMCDRWLAKDEDDGQISRELLPQSDEQSRAEAIGASKDLQKKVASTTYNVSVTTGDIKGAGTDANVHIVLYGEKDDTGLIHLKNSTTHSNKFERNQEDRFVVEAIDIGELKKIKIGHDNKGGMAGWFLNKVEIDIPSLGRRLLFPCGRWIDKGKDDGALERELYPLNEAEETYRPHIPYEVTVYTTDKRGASTGANVYVVIYGEENQTEQASLEPDKKRRKQYFKNGAIDKFVLELDDVGEEITKLRIGHDGKGWGAGWHLDKVEICRLLDGGKASKKFTFQCNRWLASDEDDGAIVRELVPSEIVEKSSKDGGQVKTKVTKPTDGLKVKPYTIHVFTGDVDGAGTNANVFLTIFGESGDSGERKLAKSDTHYDKFERNQEDIFHIEAADLGRLFKVKIRHDNTGSLFSPAWFLNRIEIVDDENEETTAFPCERWLAKKKDDGKIDRTLFIKGWEGDTSSVATTRSKASFRSNSTDLGEMVSASGRRASSRKGPVMAPIDEKCVPYNIKVTVGEESSKNFQETLHLELFGQIEEEKSGPIELSPEKKSDKTFYPGKITTFYVSAAEVNIIEKIQVSHNSYMPDSGIYLKEIEVDVPTIGNKYIFPCNRWLAKDKDDSKTSRIFTAANAQVTSYTALKPYELTIHTGDVQNAGTDSNIFVILFGTKGRTPEISLEKNEDRFERAKVDIIPLELDDVGTIKKIRIGHDGKGSRTDWYLEKASIQRMDTLDMYMFRANQWFSKKIDDKKLVREIPAETSKEGATTIKKINYVLSTHTSDKRGSGTDANVFVIIFGENGDSGEIALKKSETNWNKFEKGQTDVFLINDRLSLGRLQKLRIWHDNAGFGASWHLASVDIVDESTGVKYTFPCDKWLSKSNGDKLILRELPCAETAGNTAASKATKQESKSGKAEYEIAFTTGTEKRAGTNQDVAIVLKGKSEKSREFLIENNEDKKYFSKGKTNKFTYTCKPLGDITKAIVSHRESAIGEEPDSKNSSWYLKVVTVVHKASGTTYKFPCNKWIDLDDDEENNSSVTLKCKSADVAASSKAKPVELKPVKYEVTVVTGDEKGAGTDANVSVILYGDNGDTGPRPLKKKFVNLFERNQHDKFTIEALDLGKLTKLHIEHDNKGWGASWLLDRVEVHNVDSNETIIFPCKQWLDKKKGDGQIAKDLLPES
ncbi:Lipoxygenase homology domain-containing protein 1 [Trichoplax sp. H2]|nr:Lipoxygenase homology domain-containing protein 1 [Trichoplax sp. H2]|eukprot:RDD42008.1 Lipoxygenase homology domain-containing protein 1 [Trichoplax sp. H2]